MHIFLFNTKWMLYNISLAVIPVVLAYLMLKTKSRKIKTLVFFAWLAFLPNTIYMITDINHFIDQWSLVTPFGRIFLSIQYAILMIAAVTTFIAAQYPFEKIIRKDFKLNVITRTFIIILIDFFVAFGVILGGIERVNSWDLVTNPNSVLKNILILLNSKSQVGLTLGFGGLFSIIYFSFKDSLDQLFKK